jgi:hypothetical protein
MRSKTLLSLTLAGALAATPFMSGCEDLPGDKKTQGAVIGGLGGAAAGAVVGGEDNRLVGGLIGGALGAGGGYLVGREMEKRDKDEALEASDRAQQNPVTAEQARDARTADINRDGFVTLDEVVALEEAGLTDRQIVDRLQETGQIFALSQSQEQYLRDQGVSADVIVEMRDLNRSADGTARQARNRDLGDSTIGDDRMD